MLEAFSQDTECHRLDSSPSVSSRIPVSHDARQAWHLGQPSAVGFLLKFDTQGHWHPPVPLNLSGAEAEFQSESRFCTSQSVRCDRGSYRQFRLPNG